MPLEVITNAVRSSAWRSAARNLADSQSKESPVSKLVAWFGRSRKAVAAVVTPALAWATLVAAQPGSFQHVTAVEWVSLAVGLATGLGVYQASNDPAPVDVPVYAPTTTDPVTDHA